MNKLFLSLLFLVGLATSAMAADETIDQLGAGSAITGTESIPMFQGSSPAVTTTPNALRTYIGGGALTGAPTYGGGLSVNNEMVTPQISPWDPFRNNNVLVGPTGSWNALRNPTMTSADHYKIKTRDSPASYPLNLGIASFTGTISNGSGGAGTQLTVANPTGLVQIFQRVDDIANQQFVTTGTSPPPSSVTFANGSPVITGANTFAAGDTVQFIGSVPVNFANNTNYFVCVTGLMTTQFEVASSVVACSTPISAGSNPGGAKTVASTTLQFSGGTTGIVAGMYVTDLTTPRAVAGSITVAQVTATTVILNAPVGFYANTNILGAPGVGSGDTIAFTTVLRSTHITHQTVPFTLPAVSISCASPTVVTSTASNLVVGQPVLFAGSLCTGMTAATGTSCEGLQSTTTYFVHATGLGANSFEITSTPAGAPLNTTGSASGVTAVACEGVGTYTVDVYAANPNQLVASEMMSSAGGWTAEGVYVIPVGTAGVSNVGCSMFIASSIITGNFAPNAMVCSAGAGGVTDLIFRFPIDWVAATRLTCATYTGVFCVSSDALIQTLTFQAWFIYSANVHSVPWIESKNSCPARVNGEPGTINSCADTWISASYDLVSKMQGALPPCDSLGATPVECPYAYTFIPTGIHGDMEMQFHTGPLTSGQFANLAGFELKQTPGATCVYTVPATASWTTGTPNITMTSNPSGVILPGMNVFDSTNSKQIGTVLTYSGTALVLTGNAANASQGSSDNLLFSTAPPCFQLNAGPPERPGIVQDRMENMRFAQLIGTGYEIAFNGGNQGSYETAMGFALTTTTNQVSWKLPVSIRCDYWNANSKAAPTCTQPNFYYINPSCYIFTNGTNTYPATALSVAKYGIDSVLINGTTSGMTLNAPGYAQWGGLATTNSCMMLYDSAIIGD